MPPVSIGERIFYFTAHRSLRLIFKPIKGVCSIIKDRGNDMCVSGCGSVLKCWLMGKCRLLLPCLPLQGTGKSTEADPESIDIFYTSHCQKIKDGPALLQHCKNEVHCHSALCGDQELIHKW